MKQNKVFSVHSSHLSLARRLGSCLLIALCIHSCQSRTQNEKDSYDTRDKATSNEADSVAEPLREQYEIAQHNYLERPEDPDALIWFGRRTAYLGDYEEAINIFSTGIDLHPHDARMYRHRGHRYISTRQYDKAIADLEKAVTLIQNQPDQTEPDGLPNRRNIPLTTLHGNIWYHLGLAYYLKNDMDQAFKAFSQRSVTEKYDDNIVSGGHWQFMILSRLGNALAAEEVLKGVHNDMDIIENLSYYKMCLFYKGLLSESELRVEDPGSSSSDVLSYGLGNWYLYKKQDSLRAKTYYKQLLEQGNRSSFAYLAAEADWERIFRND